MDGSRIAGHPAPSGQRLTARLYSPSFPARLAVM